MIEIPLGGRKFTRISDNGAKFSKLDRFLVSVEFKAKWGNLGTIALERRLFDHCPVVLKDMDINFGPKPFRALDFLLEEHDIECVAGNAWAIGVKRWRPNCIFLDKFKNVKNALKVWSKQRFGETEDVIEKNKKEALRWELEAERRTLDESETEKWIEARKVWLEKEREKVSTLKQKARIKWDVEGDENSKFFHRLIKRRNNKNNIRGLMINGVWKEDPKSIMDEMRRYYMARFKEAKGGRPKLRSNRLGKLSEEEAGSLERPFDMEEVWKAICGCGGDKDLGPDGFNFKFIKRF